jgi:glutamate racemase
LHTLPLLEPKIRKFMPDGISIISQGAIVAARLEEYLERHTDIAERCSRDSQRIFNIGKGGCFSRNPLYFLRFQRSDAAKCVSVRIKTVMFDRSAPDNNFKVADAHFGTPPLSV